MNKSLDQAYCLKVTNDIEDIATENIKKIYIGKTKEEELVAPYDEETTNFICDQYFNRRPTPKITELVNQYLEMFPDEIKDLSEKD